MLATSIEDKRWNFVYYVMIIMQVLEKLETLYLRRLDC